MNKMAKGALATGVGVALMLGGGGTLAIWNDTETASVGSITSGQLEIKRVDNGVWTNSSNQVVDLASYKVVPGETLSFEQNVDLTLVGDKIEATLTPTYIGGMDGLSRHLDYTYKVFQNNAEIRTNALTMANDGIATVKATVTFKKDSDNTTQVKTQDLTKIQYVLQQVVR